MNSIATLFSSSFVQTIGWTLLHSVWQAFTVLLIVTVLNRIIKDSSIRYGISLIGFVSILLLSVITFLYLQSGETHTPLPAATSTPDFQWPSTNESVKLNLSSSTITDTIQSHMYMVVGCWIAGVILFSLRVLGGSIYVSTLRRNSTVWQNGWSIRVHELAYQLSINKVVTLAESTCVHAPVLLGYIKPVIILPIGMLSGLSTEQVDMILTHELMHIKRHDYLMNIVQLIMESIFFFNPFVWILSEDIRKEREHCCDDAVVALHPNAQAYAAALARLEEVRLSRIEPALGLAQNKNQLLNRIKRLMENSVKNYSARGRVIPLVLLAIGLICASWLTISRESNTLPTHPNTVLARQDTSIHQKSKKGSYSRTQVVTTNQNGEPREEIIESYDGDFTSFIVSPVEPPEMPGVPDFDMDMVAPPFPDFIYEYDTVPGKGFYFSLHDFEKFSEQFQKEFKEQFGCYTKNQKDSDTMMKELEQNLQMEMNNAFAAKVNADMVRQEAMLQHQFQKEILASNLEQHAMAMAEHTKALAKMDEDLKHWEKDHAAQMKEFEKNMQRMDENMKRFEKELQKELVKDGYLKANEELKNIHWNTKGDIEINDKKISDEHKAKYNKLHERFFDEKHLTPAE